jgi:hypothetical protein
MSWWIEALLAQAAVSIVNHNPDRWSRKVETAAVIYLGWYIHTGQAGRA